MFHPIFWPKNYYDKAEVMLLQLGNQKLNPATLATCSGKDITIKKAILGVYFTHNQFLWKKLKIYKREAAVLELEKSNNFGTNSNCEDICCSNSYV